MLLKPAFGIRNTLFQFKHTRLKLKTMYLLLKTVFEQTSKEYCCTNQLPFSTALVCNTQISHH